MAFNSRGVTGGVTPARFRFQRERREETVAVMMLTGGSHLSARGERERGNGSGRGFLGCGLLLELGRFVSPGPLFYFYFLCFFSFSVFFISFIHLSNLIQNDSNQLCKVSIIQNNHTEQ
jgi:hypothetical protein